MWGCEPLHGPCVVSYGFLQGCAVGLFGRARVCTRGCSAGWAQGFFIGVLCWLHGRLYLVYGWGFLLVWLLLRVRCRAWCRHAVSTRCAAVARRGLLSKAGAPGVGCAGGCWRGFASCRVLCVPFSYCVLLLIVRVVCSNYCSLLPVVYGRFCVLMLLVLYAPGPQCTATYALFNKLGYFAADSGRATKGGWIEGALRRLSVALCKGNDFVFHANLHSFCCATGKHLTRGAAVPHTLEV